MTFAFAGVAEHEAASDQFCEHLSCFLQAVGRCVGARLFSLFFSCLSSSDFPLFFSLCHLTVTATSSPDLSALHLCQLFTFTLLHPPPPDVWPWNPATAASVAPVRLNGEDIPSQADVSHPGEHHTGSVRRHELFTLFFPGRKSK